MLDELGFIWKKMTITATTFLIGSLALDGVFPLAGFWSKDEILHSTLDWGGGWAFILLAFAAVLTAFYTTRLFVRTFLGQPNDQHISEHTHASSFLMTGPLLFLCLSGVRSHNAATALAQAGHSHAYNILQGFEGDRDMHGRRNTVGGWRFAGLPWTQS